MATWIEPITSGEQPPASALTKKVIHSPRNLTSPPSSPLPFRCKVDSQSRTSKKTNLMKPTLFDGVRGGGILATTTKTKLSFLGSWGCWLAMTTDVSTLGVLLLTCARTCRWNVELATMCHPTMVVPDQQVASCLIIFIIFIILARPASPPAHAGWIRRW